jgi:hypothetical protein
MKTIPFEIGNHVTWKWAGGVIKGEVLEVHFAPIERIIKGSKIKRNGSVEKPAYLVKSAAGNLALKLQTELTKL